MITNLAFVKSRAKRTEDVPFNIGTDKKSQSIVERTRKHAMGWGGVYYDILASMPKLKESDAHEEL